MDALRSTLILIALTAVTAAGCKSDPYMDAYFDTVNAEKRALEDVIYDLKYENEQLRDKLKSGGGATATPASAGSSNEGSSDDSESFDGGYGPLVVPPSGDGPTPTPSIDAPTDPDLSVPMTTPGIETNPKEIFPDLGDSEPGAAPNQSVRVLDHQPEPTNQIAAAGATVTHLHINRVATRGRNTDGRPGDDLLVIGLEPRDQYGRFVAAANNVSIVLLDPDVRGQDARVAQWQFDAATVAEGAQHAGAHPVILLEAVWPKRPPTNSRLQLWARYTTSDGRILQTKEMIHITPAGDLSARWTPRTGSPTARMATRADDGPQWKPNR